MTKLDSYEAFFAGIEPEDGVILAGGDISLCPESARYDRYGNDRFTNGTATDLGAYVWIEKKEQEK
ncbi:MAG: hypothetical protein SOW62_00950 [Sodaliphilus sp.]|nr:hypothetical protein [Sodaliphilus sp.]